MREGEGERTDSDTELNTSLIYLLKTSCGEKMQRISSPIFRNVYNPLMR